jgi:ADP-heptose:LPS heptosyltransferase
MPQWSDIVMEASLVRALDLMISIDSLPAHLAGALGVPVWTLLQKDADWRWMEARADSPWYPTMRLFRQQRAGEWRPVIAAVAAELAELSAARSSGSLSTCQRHLPSVTEQINERCERSKRALRG